MSYLTLRKFFEKEKLRKKYQKLIKTITRPSSALIFVAIAGTALASFYYVKQVKSLQQIMQLEERLEAKSDSLEQFLSLEQEKGLSFLVLKERVPEYKNLESITAFRGYSEAKKYIPLVKEAIKKHEEIWPLDPLLVLCWIKEESAFNRFAVSPKGASGLTQLMPTTAQSLDMAVYVTDDFHKARALDKKAQEYYYLKQQELKKSKPDYVKIKSCNERYKKLSNQAAEHYVSYKTDLVEIAKLPDNILIRIHQPFDGSAALNAGIEHLATCFKTFKGDIRLALCAYNAGANAVYKARGIPYIAETICSTNRIISDYKILSQWIK